MRDDTSSWPWKSQAKFSAPVQQGRYDLHFLDVEICPSEELRQPWLAFHYEESVFDGGHFQFFAQGGLGLTTETRRALCELGCSRQERILESAVTLYESQCRPAHYGLAELLATVGLCEFSVLDEELGNCVPTIETMIRLYFQEQHAEPAWKQSKPR